MLVVTLNAVVVLIMKVAIVHDAFFGDAAEELLLSRLNDAKAGGASLVVLSELPLNKWMAITKVFDGANAEEFGIGPRLLCLQRCAKAAGISVVGGAITYPPGTDPNSLDVSQCESTCWLIDDTGKVLTHYSKVHLPEEEGYWETSHYHSSANLPKVVQFSPSNAVDKRPWSVGLQLCSDIMRPAGSSYLSSQGVQLLIHPRATPLSSYQKRWVKVVCSTALTSAAYVISVNRPSTGQADTPCGGSSIVAAPSGDILHETTDPLSFVTVCMDEVNGAKEEYPGYMWHAKQLLPANC